MLINKGFSQGDTVTIKLSTGEELICRFVEETDQGYKVNRPMVLSANQQGIGMMPYLFTVHPDTDTVINKSSVILACATDSDFAKQYTQATTGIALR
jgi:hypothetical protein